MSRLTRRALFALPVALPVAAVAAKVGVLARVRSMWGGVLSPAAVRRVENLKPLPFTLEELWEPPGVKSPFRLVKTVEMGWPKSDAIDKAFDELLRSARGPATFSDDELAATLGIKPQPPGAIGIDAGGNDDMTAVAVVQPAQPVVA